MLDQSNGSTKRLSSQGINRSLGVIQGLIGDICQDFINELVDLIRFESNGIGTYLLMISHNHDFFGQGKCYQAEHITLTGLIDDQNIKTSCCDIETFDHSRKGHDPDRHGLTTFGQGLFGLFLEYSNVLAPSFPYLLVQTQPTIQSLLLRQPRAFKLG